jgi:hypothetical protein
MDGIALLAPTTLEWGMLMIKVNPSNAEQQA